MSLRERRAIKEDGGDAELEVQEWYCDGAAVRVRFSDDGRSVNECGYFDAREMLEWIEHVRRACKESIRQERYFSRRRQKAPVDIEDKG